MDKSWISKDRDTLEYEIMVEIFLITLKKIVKILRAYLVFVHFAAISKKILC